MKQHDIIGAVIGPYFRVHEKSPHAEQMRDGEVPFCVELSDGMFIAPYSQVHIYNVDKPHEIYPRAHEVWAAICTYEDLSGHTYNIWEILSWLNRPGMYGKMSDLIQEHGSALGYQSTLRNVRERGIDMRIRMR